jgi:hypothetical protein
MPAPKKDETVIGPAGSQDSPDFQEAVRQAVEKELAARQPAPPPATAGGNPLHTHSAGPGDTIAETWSYHDQQLAIRGEHPSQQEERQD